MPCSHRGSDSVRYQVLAQAGWPEVQPAASCSVAWSPRSESPTFTSWTIQRGLTPGLTTLPTDLWQVHGRPHRAGSGSFCRAALHRSVSRAARRGGSGERHLALLHPQAFCQVAACCAASSAALLLTAPGNVSQHSSETVALTCTLHAQSVPHQLPCPSLPNVLWPNKHVHTASDMHLACLGQLLRHALHCPLKLSQQASDTVSDMHLACSGTAWKRPAAC